ncbi:SNW/SKI-interacting protein A-like [Cornus florida]|uniref:SNW/SKI-interacting protein A-like n=1 Tax=Cornus florida TaxID=4283 RepID=UPI00289B3C2D|nr:SNW/SKI-interacting protein A-like [Cornus florida]XP_059652388.1 SNW/SKI-interacting protein A-like [Cornus florida]
MVSDQSELGFPMTTLKELLPPVTSSSGTWNYDHSNEMWFKQGYSAAEAEQSALIKSKPVPPYLKSGFWPSKPEDFGDGGAFPEINHAQYPLDMGRKNVRKTVLPVTVDEHGNVRYDAIVKQNENASKVVYSQHRDLVPMILKNEKEEEPEEDLDELEKKIEETTQETKAALEKILNVNTPTQSSDSKFIKYKPSQQSADFSSGAKERIVRMAEMVVDPLDPPKFKHKRVPKGSGSPPVPVMQSPPRPVTLKDQQDWKIPPCISNWKNPKGYSIPLDKRLAGDGRGLEEVQINDNFAKLSEALYVSEQKAREAVAMRSRVQKEMMMKEKEKKEHELRDLAQRARSERAGVAVAPPPGAVPSSSDKTMMDVDDVRGDYERLQREKIREERRRERRQEAKDAAMGKKSKITRDGDRDVSEKIALGMASTGAGRGGGGQVMYDQRLFNQEKGMESGFATDDQYNVYDKGLFTAQPTLYRPKKDVDSDMYGGTADEHLDKIMKTERFKPDRGFVGTSGKSGPRDRPVEFDKEAQEPDPFGLDPFFTAVEKSQKAAMDKVGSGGTMKASAGSSMRDGDEGSGRTRVAFERGRE